jgi:hypothetical protein
VTRPIDRDDATPSGQRLDDRVEVVSIVQRGVKQYHWTAGACLNVGHLPGARRQRRHAFTSSH